MELNTMALAELFGFGLLALIVAFGLGALYCWHFVKDYFVHTPDSSTKEFFERYKDAPIEKQDLVKEIVEDD